jgi:hypothetical protein
MKISNRIVFFLTFVSVGSFILATYVESVKVTEFFVQNRTLLENDSERLILATTIVNRNDGSDAFLQKEPILYSEFENENASGTLSIYMISLFSKQEHTNLIAFYLEDIRVFSEDVLLDDNDQVIIQMSLTFNEFFLIGQSELNQTVEIFITLYNDHQKLILIEIDKLLTQKPNLAIIELEFSYLNSNQDKFIFFDIKQNNLQKIILNEMQIYEKYRNNYFDHPSVIYDEQLLNDFQSLDVYYIYHFGIYISIIGMSVYFLFFKGKKN